MLCTGSGDNTARLWDLDTETPKFTLSGHTGWLLCVEWDGMERIVATGSMDNTVSLKFKSADGLDWPGKGGRSAYDLVLICLGETMGS